MSRGVLGIGSGQGGRRAALPALLARSEAFHIAGIYSRKPKTIVAEDKDGQPAAEPLEVQPLAELTAETVAAADLVFVCVSKGAVPTVLAQLATLARAAGDKAPALLIDTPVLYFKHMAAAAYFSAFREVWVAEDMSTLPWLDAVAAAGLGRPTRLTLDRSAFAYHGVALAKTLLGDMRLTRARRKRLEGKSPRGETRHERHFHFASGGTCHVLEPREYAAGGFRLEGTQATLADPGDQSARPGDLRISCHFDQERCLGFQVQRDGEVLHTTELAPHEVDLLGVFGTNAAPGVIAHMDAMKRVGFARLLDRIAIGAPLWRLDDGLDDMWIDYLIEKTGRWRRTPFTSAHSGLARSLVATSMSLALKLKR
jgi:hypothetical protein